MTRVDVPTVPEVQSALSVISRYADADGDGQIDGIPQLVGNLRHLLPHMEVVFSGKTAAVYVVLGILYLCALAGCAIGIVYIEDEFWRDSVKVLGGALLTFGGGVGAKAHTASVHKGGIKAHYMSKVVKSSNLH